MNKKISPLEIARQTLLELAKSKVPPTPDNYRRVYDEISGVQSENSSDLLSQALGNILHEAGKDQPKYLTSAKAITLLVERCDQIKLEEHLRKLLPISNSENGEVGWGVLLRNLFKQLEANHRGLTVSRKKEGLNRVLINFANDPVQLGQKIQALVASWGDGQTSSLALESVQEPAEIADGQVESIIPDIPDIQSKRPQVSSEQQKILELWRDMLINAIKLLVAPQLGESEQATRRLQDMVARAQRAQTLEEVSRFSELLKSILLRAEMQCDADRRMQESLVQLLKLVVASMNELVTEDKWLHGQLTVVQEIISKPLNLDTLYNAESSLKELLHKQASIKPGLFEAKEAIKNMVSSFVSHLADMAASTGNYQEKIENYQHEISSIEDVSELNAILGNLLGDVSAMNAEAKNNHLALKETQKKAEEAEKKIDELTAKLDYISEVAHQDFLTGALNRRGMDEAIEREFKRADRHNTALSLAMLDIDHFKKINDTMGHATGDVALAHLARVIKNVIRSTDVLARYGGEEFIILLPGTGETDAVNVMSGVQRELTRNFFLHDNERVLITFSAGVSERMAGEPVDVVMPRADKALYYAKKTGRNKVVSAAQIELEVSRQDQQKSVAGRSTA